MFAPPVPGWCDAMVIASNMVASQVARTLGSLTSEMSSSLSRLSAGSRVVSPADDPGGLALSMKFSAEIRRIGAARSNVANTTSYSQTQDGYLTTIDTALQRMSELATLSTDSTKTSAEVTAYNTEFVELKSVITTAAAKQYNGQNLFGGVALADTDLNADSDTTDTEDARISTQLTALTSAYTTWVADPTHASASNYDYLTSMRDAIADMATEMKQYSDSSTTETDYDGSAWSTTYTYWSGVTGKTWTGLDSHAHTGNASANVATSNTLSNALRDEYKNMYNDVVTHVNTYGGGLSVTNSSDAGSYQIKAADLTYISSAISSSTDVNSVSATLTASNASTYVTNITNLISHLTSTQSYVGSNISRLQNVSDQLASYGENLSAANSRIVDVDVAEESSNYARLQILVQTATAMLAQANVIPQIALRLIT